MTTGTRVVDLRTSWTTNCGSGIAGLYSSKTWSGTDQPKTPKVVAYRFVRTSKLIPYVTKFGARRNRRVSLPPEQHMYLRSAGPKRGRQKAEHPYHAEIMRRDDGFVNWSYLGNTGPIKTGTLAQCAGGWTHLGDYNWSANDELILINKLSDKLLGNSVNVGVFLAELPQAAQMIADSAVRIARAYKHARAGQWVKAERALVDGVTQGRKLNIPKRAASNWLELQYGWLPLLNDVYAGAQMLAHMTECPFEEVVRVRRTVKLNGLVGIGSSGFGSVSESWLKVSKGLKAIIKEVNVPKLLGLTDPASVLWEKLPYSFVADWFIPIGNYLSARGVSQSLAGTFVSSQKKHYHGKGVVTNKSTINLVYNGERLFYDYIVMDRTVTSSLQVPFPSFKPLNKVASWQHMANAVALLTPYTQKGVHSLNNLRKAGYTD